MGTASNLHDIKHLDKISVAGHKVALLKTEDLARIWKLVGCQRRKTASRASAQRSQKTTDDCLTAKVRQNTESTDGGTQDTEARRGFHCRSRGVLSGFMSIRRGHRIARAKAHFLSTTIRCLFAISVMIRIGGYAALPPLTFSCSSGTLCHVTITLLSAICSNAGTRRVSIMKYAYENLGEDQF